MDSEFKLNPNKWIEWYTRDDVNFVYIPIHRCATNWMLSKLTNNGFYKVVPKDRHLHKDKERLVILREPTERVLSGMFVAEQVDFSILDSNVDKEQFEKILSQDIHTSGQVKYLPPDRNNCVYFKFDAMLPYKISNYMHKSGVALEPGPMKWTKIQIGGESRERREKVYNDPKLLNMFKEYLKEDYELYNSVEFYGTN